MVSVRMVLATSLVDVLVLQHKFNKRNQELSMFIAWGTVAVLDTCRTVKVMAETFYTVFELGKVFKYRAKKKSMLLKLKADISHETMGIRPLCPTRWTVQAESLRSVILNYSIIHSVLEEIMKEYREATFQARVIMVTMEKFFFLFGVVIREKLFSITYTLSEALQKKTMCGIDAISTRIASKG